MKRTNADGEIIIAKNPIYTDTHGYSYGVIRTKTTIFGKECYTIGIMDSKGNWTEAKIMEWNRIYRTYEAAKKDLVIFGAVYGLVHDHDAHGVIPKA